METSKLNVIFQDRLNFKNTQLNYLSLCIFHYFVNNIHIIYKDYSIRFFDYIKSNCEKNNIYNLTLLGNEITEDNSEEFLFNSLIFLKTREDENKLNKIIKIKDFFTNEELEFFDQFN